MKRWLTGLIIGYALTLPLACASDKDSVKNDSKALCEVYNPDNWQEYFKNTQPTITDIYREIGKKIRNAVETKEIISIYKELNKGYKANVYDFVKSKVSRLIGEPWECSHFKNFYFPRKEIEFSVESFDQAVNPLDKKLEIIISVDAQGLLHIDSEKAIEPNFDTVKSAIQANNKYRDARFVLYIDAKAPHQTLITIVAVLKTLGISKFSVATG